MAKINGKKISRSHSMQEWNPKATIRQISPLQVKLSKGFLQIEEFPWLTAGMREHWLPLFYSLGLEVRLKHLSTALIVPENFSEVTYFNLNDEVCCLGMHQPSADIITSCIGKYFVPQGEELIIDYFQRRFISTLSQAWSKRDKQCIVEYLGRKGQEDSILRGSIKLECSVSGKDVTIWICLGPQSISFLDLLSKEEGGQDPYVEGVPSEHYVAAKLVSLMFEPSELTDFLKPGTIIDLGSEVGDEINIVVEDNFCARGKLAQVNSFFCIDIDEIVSGDNVPSGMTEVSVELFREKVSSQDIHTLIRKGAIYQSDSIVSNKVILFISEEKVAKGKLLVSEGKFAVELEPTV